jgi:hypothetical protein
MEKWRLTRLDYVSNGAPARLAVGDDAIAQGKQGVVFPQTDVLAWVDLGADLTNEDCTGVYGLAAKYLDASPLTVAVATVAGTPLPFFV